MDETGDNHRKHLKAIKSILALTMVNSQIAYQSWYSALLTSKTAKQYIKTAGKNKK